jgi:hypothetical protein
MADEPQLRDFLGGPRTDFVHSARDSALGRTQLAPSEAGEGETGAAAATSTPVGEAAAEATEEGAAAPVVQEPTLEEAKAQGITLPERNVALGVDLGRKAPGERREWYLEKLGALENQLQESSERHRVPMRLLAAVILNELAVIDVKDIAQEAFFVLSGSLGIAQIQIDTVISDDLFPDMTRAEIRDAYNWYRKETREHFQGPLDPDDTGRRVVIRRRLRIPQHAIDAAAREIRYLLWASAENLHKPWQTTFGFTWGGLRPADPQLLYQKIGSQVNCRSIEDLQKPGFEAVVGKEGEKPDREQEKNLAYMVSGAYNSPDVIRTDDIGKYENAGTHGHNACLIAADLYDFGLFGP